MIRNTMDTQAVRIRNTKYPTSDGANADPNEKPVNSKADMTVICVSSLNNVTSPQRTPPWKTHPSPAVDLRQRPAEQRAQPHEQQEQRVADSNDIPGCMVGRSNLGDCRQDDRRGDGREEAAVGEDNGDDGLAARGEAVVDLVVQGDGVDGFVDVDVGPVNARGRCMDVNARGRCMNVNALGRCMDMEALGGPGARRIKRPDGAQLKVAVAVACGGVVLQGLAARMAKCSSRH